MKSKRVQSGWYYFQPKGSKKDLLEHMVFGLSLKGLVGFGKPLLFQRKEESRRVVQWMWTYLFGGKTQGHASMGNRVWLKHTVDVKGGIGMVVGAWCQSLEIFCLVL